VEVGDSEFEASQAKVNETISQKKKGRKEGRK
jgi:hypothetical protein